MFEFIRNSFRKFLSLVDVQNGLTRWRGGRIDDDWDWTQGQYYLTTTDRSYFPTPNSKRTEHLTQRDLQILQSILAKHIQVAEIVCKEIKEEALEYEVGDDLRSVLFGEHRKVREYLKKISALQHRLKHKIRVGG